MKEWKITSEKQLNNSETCTCICHGYYGYTCKVGRPNIDALATAIITVHSFIAMQMPDSEYSVAMKIWFLLKLPFYTLLQCLTNVRRAEWKQFKR